MELPSKWTLRWPMKMLFDKDTQISDAMFSIYPSTMSKVAFLDVPCDLLPISRSISGLSIAI